MSRLPRVLLVALCSLGCEDEPQPVPKKLAQLVSVVGTVSLAHRAGAPQPAAPGVLVAGDVIVTGAASSAVISSNEGRQLEIGENARFLVDTRIGEVRLQLEQGVISIVGGEGSGAVSLSVLTPYGETSLSPGMRGRLAVGPAGLVVDVEVGSITVLADDGGAQTASAGQKLKVTLGSIEIVEEPKSAPVVEQILELPPIEVRLVSEAGMVKLKAPGARKFVPTAGKVTPLAEGTAFQLSSGARARLEADGIRLRLSAGAGLLEKAAQVGEERIYRLQLGNGPAQALFTGGKTSLLLGGKGGELALQATAEAAVIATRTATGARIEVQSGEVQLTLAGQTQTVKAGQLAELSGTAVQIKARARPSLLLPSGRKVSVHAQALDEVGLSWPAGEAASVEVSTDPAFKDLLLSGRAAESWVAVAAPAEGSLFWRVLDATGQPRHQGQARFAPDRNRAGAVIPTSEVAETGLKTTVYFQSALPTLAFTFPAKEGARHYRMKVFRAADLKTPLFEREVSEPRCVVQAGALGEGAYLWYAAALDAAKNEQSGGRMNKLDILYDNSLTSLIIDRPQWGEKAAPGGPLASGVAPLRTRLFINGAPAALDPQGRFSVQLAPAQSVIFRVVDPEGGESFWVRRLGK